MDIGKELLQRHDKANATKIADYVGHNRARFKQLIVVYLAGPNKIAQRASWPLTIGVERHPGLVLPHLKRLLDYLATPGLHDAAKRNTIRMLQYVDLPKRSHGRVISVCFRYLQDKKQPVAIRVFAMTVLGRLTKDLPDLKRELRIIIEDQLPYSSAGFISRARKVTKGLDISAKADKQNRSLFQR